MKKVLFTIVIASMAVFARAQEKATAFKPFKVDVAVGYAVPGGSGSKAGVILALEPKYSLNDQLTLGLRFETALTARAVTSSDGSTFTGDVKGMGSYLATADYFFNTHSFRPFAGLGLGLVNVAAADVDGNASGVNQADVEAASKLGITPRVGFEYGHFRTGIEYNIVGKTGAIKNNYLGIKMGFFFGGGRRSK